MGRRTRRLGRRAGTTALALVTTAMGVTGIAAAASLPSVAPAPDRLPAPAAPQENGLLRVAHLSPSTGAVDMYAEGPGLPATRVASAVSYRGLTPYLPAAPGTYTLSARPAGASATSVPALTTTVAVTPGSAQTAAFVDVGPDSAPQAEVIADRTTAPPPGSALVRVIAAAAGVGAVDVVAQGGGPLADDVFYGATSDYATVDARVWTMDITTSSGQSTQVTVPVASRSVSSVIVSRDPQGALAVTAVPDAASATPAPEAPATSAPATSAPTTSAPTAPSTPRRTPTGGVPAGFGGLVAADAPAIPVARAMPVVAVPTPRDAVRPTGLAVPAADVDADRLLDLGVDGAGALQAPPGPQDVGWFAGGAVPGAAGPSVLVGHVDSWRGPGVFWRLRDLRAGDAVDVPRSDGTVAHFVVDAVERFDKDAFPSERVYGPTAGPSLRLVTCGGAFDRSTRSYEDNVVVFASPR